MPLLTPNSIRYHSFNPIMDHPLKICWLWHSFVASLILADCPDTTWVPHKTNGYCYKFFGDQRNSWTKSEYLCTRYNENAHLASVHSKEEMDFIFSLINDSNSHWQHDDHLHHYAYMSDFAWIGLTTFCPENSRGRWTDGSPIDYSLLKMPVNDERSDKCVAYYISHSKPKWITKFCGSLGPYICKVAQNISSLTEKNVDDLCGDWRWCRFEEKCYRIDTLPKVWLDARSSCRQNGGDLLSVHSEDELIYVLQKFLSGWDIDESFWTGLNKYESMDERFRWSDNTPLDYVPKMSIEYLEWRKASCVMLSSRNMDYILQNNGQVWKLDRCDKKHMSICWKQTRNYTNPSLSTLPNSRSNNLAGYCKPGWTRYSNKCYKAYGIKDKKERAAFFNASAVCYTENAHLVSIKDVYENLFVLSLVNGVETSWIGLIYQMDKLHWLDETKISFVSFDANSLSLYAAGENELPKNYAKRCFAMSVSKTPGFWEPFRTSVDFAPILVSKTLARSNRTRHGGLFVESTEFGSHSGSRLLFHAIRTTRAISFPRIINWKQQTINDQLCEKENMSFVCEQAVTSKFAPLQSGMKGADDLCQNSTSGNKAFSFGSSCYEFFSDSRSWKEAEEHCKSFVSKESPFNSSHLVSINSLHDFAFVTSRAKEMGFDQFWIGLTNSDHRTFMWSDHQPETFSQWSKGEPRNPVDSGVTCVKMKLNDESGAEWAMAHCDSVMPYICKKTNDVPSSQNKVTGTCPEKWLQGSSQCYRIINEDWTSGSSAILKCWREHNATLASFQNMDDINRIIKRNEIVHAKRRFLIGLIQKVNGRYEWLNGDPLNFVNWAPTEPGYEWNADVEVCVEMDHKGLWYDTGCYETRHYICSIPKIPLTAGTSSSTAATTISAPKSTLSQSLSSRMQTTLTVTLPQLVRKISNSKPTQQDFSNSTSEKIAKFSARTRPANISGSRWAVALGSTFLAACFVSMLFVAYKKRLTLRKLWLNRSADPASMRFEILNETDDI